MSSALKAVEADRETVLALARELDDSVWSKASGCPGWSARDVLSHMACSFWLAVDPSMLPDPGGLPAERAADLYVESRRNMTHEQIVADYEAVSAKGLEVLAALQDQDVRACRWETSEPTRHRPSRTRSPSNISSTSDTTSWRREDR